MTTPGPGIGAIAAWQIDLGVAPPSSGPVGAAAAGLPKLQSFSSNDYRGRVDATLSSGLDPGRYAITVEGITEDQFRDAKSLASKQPSLCANLYLYWIDAATTPGLPPVVAVLRVTALRRRPGTWRYELIIEGREWVYDLLGRPAPQVGGTSSFDRAQAIAKECKIVFSPARLPSDAAAQTIDEADPNSKESARDTLIQLDDRMVEEAANTRGVLGMYLIRDGTLQIGPNRLDKVTPVDVAADSGLLMIERRGALAATDGSTSSDSGPVQASRDTYTATLRGRPDLKPGDVVALTSPELDSSDGDFDIMLGPAPASTNKVTAYVHEVEHRLSREQGFTTVIHCIAAATGPGKLVDQLWVPTSKTATAVGSGEGQIARQIRSKSGGIGTEIAQVRQLFAKGDKLPPQTEKLLRGPPNDGKPHGSIRLGFDQTLDTIKGVPYASPFAWGPFGLSVPRYPGMRVVLGHRRGQPDDAIDLGALWTKDSAPAAQPGDWWLCLPAAIAADQRASVKDGAAPRDPTGKASNDLTDADGNRVIAVGKLTVRVGSNALTDGGTRPTVSDPPVSIEHSSGATITIDQNGAIVIQAKGKLTLGCDQDIVLDANAITMQVGSSVAITKKS
jgi:hypothetical protein